MYYFYGCLKNSSIIDKLIDKLNKLETNNSATAKNINRRKTMRTKE